MLFAAVELLQTLYAAWNAADLWRRLQAWWYVVTHRRLLDGESLADAKREAANA